MTRRGRRLALVVAGAFAASGIAAAAPIAWQDLAESDWLYPLATRFADVEGHRVAYPVPPAELAPLLEARSEAAAKRELAEARLALGDRAGARVAMESWAEAEGPAAWAEAARWGAQLGDMDLAFRAAARALPGLEEGEREKLLAERVAWADAHPDAADPLRMRAERAQQLPANERAAEDWLRALEKAGRLDDALAGVEQSRALSPERRLLLRSDLAADHGDAARAFQILDAAIDGARDWPMELRRAFAQRAAPLRAAESWRSALETGFDSRALVRLTTVFEGQNRGELAAELLRQVERRYETGFGRAEWLLLARLHAEIDAVPEAFRARLAAANGASAPEQADDLAALAALALRAGARPLGWGAYDDEPYRWAARVDRTPGFWTGGVAFLTTGTRWDEALAQLESASLAERTFGTARALVAELALRVPAHPELAPLRAQLMARHVERGEGQDALALLPLVTGEAVREARRAALLAMRQVDVPLGEEVALWKARLAALAPDGSRPATSRSYEGASYETAAGGSTAWDRTLASVPPERYSDVLDEATSRLDERDPSHRAAASLMLSEMDRLPRAEELWLEMAERLERWNLDDEVGPRYERALLEFTGSGWWSRAARWYARRSRDGELLRLADELTRSFRGAAILARAPIDDDVRLRIPEASRAGARVSLASWGDWVRFKAFQRFPQSAAIYRELRRRAGRSDSLLDPVQLEERGYGVLFVDEQQREALFADAFRRGVLSEWLARWEARPSRTPVEELLLFEGRARLSQFEQAAGPAARLNALYPGDAVLAQRVLSLHRSLASLDPGQAQAAAAVVARSAPALVDARPLWTELGELEHESGHPDRAKEAWRHLLDGGPRDAAQVEALATVLWDYGEMDAALAAIEDARGRTARPWLLAFEAGVLREEKHDAEGAVREYLHAGQPEEGECFCSAYERDQRALRRLSQLVGRERVRRAIEARVASLRPGVAADEETLSAFLPLTTIQMPGADLDWTADDWIDGMDHPVDPLAREARQEARESWRAATYEGQRRIAAVLLARTRAFVAEATRPGFLDAVERWAEPLLAAQPTRGDEVELRAAIMGRRAALAPTPEQRVALEVERARYLLSAGRSAEADGAWREIVSRIAALPEGAPRMRAEAERAAFLERTRGSAAAATEWERLSARYPWSLGILEDRSAFLKRMGREAESRALVEAAAAGAERGHREALLERLAREAIAAGDLGQAQRAAEGLLAAPTTDDGRRLAGAHLLARLMLRREGGGDLVALAKEQEARLSPESRPELFAQLARAAAQESAWAGALTMWIEALNRRLDRAWLREACRAAARAGQQADLVSFFERQRARSPRDVRWAVALRELRLYFDDVQGALDAARAAIAVRPDRGSLWYEAADLLARVGRPAEGAALLADWGKTRPADEDVATRRAALLAVSGDAAGALVVEREALAAFAAQRPLDEDRQNELSERRARAARRLSDLGLPREAFALVSPARDGRLLASGLGAWDEARLALAAGRLLPLLRQRLGDSDFAWAAGSVLAQRGRPEEKEEVIRWLAAEIVPQGGGSSRIDLSLALRLVDDEALADALRVELARRRLAQTPGPWAGNPPESFVSAVAATVVDPSRTKAVASRATLDALWARDLVHRQRADELWTFVEPRWTALVAEVRSETRLPAARRISDWRSWLAEPETFALWVQGARGNPSRLASIVPLLEERRLWQRLHTLGAKDWKLDPLVAVLPDEARTAWFRSRSESRAGGRTEDGSERVALALGRLVQGREEAASAPEITGLRGAALLGAFLDEKTLPDAALWGERSGPSWLVLETLARLRSRDAEAALVPLELPDRAGEADRARLATRLAEHLGDAALASVLVEQAPAARAPDLRRRLRLLQATGRGEDAAARFQAEVRRQQPKLNEASFRDLVRTADDLGLADPLSLLDAKVAVPGPFLAFVCDARGLEACRALSPVARPDFRSALASRWQSRSRPLTPEETRFALTELWAEEAGELPSAGLARLAGVWPHASAWLATLRSGERRLAITALDALPDDTPLEKLLSREATASAEAQLLRLRVHLLRGEEAKAVALFGAALESEDHAALAFTPVSVLAPEVLGEEAGASEELTPPAAADPFVTRLEALTRPFRDAGKLDLVAVAARDALLRRCESAPGSAPAWALALDLSWTPETRAAVSNEIERAFRMGDLDAGALEPIVLASGRIEPAAADRWLARATSGPDFAASSSRARVLAALGRKAQAAAFLASARERRGWTAAEEVRAFDLWRSLAPPPAARDAAPAAWSAARAFWTRPAAATGDLAAHLRAHPLDVRAGRALLRSASPVDPDLAALAARTLGHGTGEETGWADRQFLALRAARAQLSFSAKAALAALSEPEVSLHQDLVRRRLPSSEVLAALGDVARILTAAAPLEGPAPHPAVLASALAFVEDRDPQAGRALRTELRRLQPPVALRPYHLANGDPQPFAPRDLDWPIVASVLDAEAAR